MTNVLFIAVGLAMDSFGVSIALGNSAKKKIYIQGLISSVMFGVFQAFMPVVGWIVGVTFKSFISGVDH